MRHAPNTLPIIVLCLFALTATAAPLGVPFTLGIGESVVVGNGGLEVGFDIILSDSRCPADAYCFWEGDAAADLWSDDPDGEPLGFVLHTTLYPQQVYTGDYRIELIWVAPYPMSSGVPIPPETYEVMLVVLSTVPTQDEARTWGAVKTIYR
ncbi:hypothetical protein H8E07_19050 [bacterium]|nr:hypothetical protein [bacterium]